MNALHGLDDLPEALERAGLADAPHGDLESRCEHYLHRYARLERRLWGGVSFVVPEHLLEPGEDEDPLEAVENLARRERERLAWGGTGERDLLALLDREGLKVYRPEFPAGSPLEGIFLFDAEVGPAFIVDGGLAGETSNGVAARLYGHYLLDHDPYEIRLARTAGSDDARTLRARHFAAALLVDAGELRAYLEALPGSEPRPITRETLEHLQAFFEVDARTLIARLLVLGWIQAGDVLALAAGADPERRRDPVDVLGLLPERYVRLVLEAHARGVLTAESLAEHLESDLPSALRLAAHFTLGSEPAPEAP